MNAQPMLWTQVRRALRSLIFASRIMRLNSEIGSALRDFAEIDRRPMDEVAADLLAIAIARRRAAEINLRRWGELTPREQQVTALTCLNLTNAEIARRLVLSPETVKTHIRNVLAKFNLNSKEELRRLLSDWDFSAWAGEEVDE
jgi:DNA-binding CsgD family transcriptional regulator